MGTPDMQIRGNGSSPALLRWFDDRTDTAPDQPFVFSVPMLAYRAAMLAWALWLAASLLRWLRWGWFSFSSDGVWKRKPPRPIAPSPAMVPPIATQPDLAGQGSPGAPTENG